MSKIAKITSLRIVKTHSYKWKSFESVKILYDFLTLSAEDSAKFDTYLVHRICWLIFKNQKLDGASLLTEYGGNNTTVRRLCNDIDRLGTTKHHCRELP